MMKKKTRIINVGDKEYVYVINNIYNQGVSNICLSISLQGMKNQACSFHFCTWEDPITGSPY
jgi:hypothetical protein